MIKNEIHYLSRDESELLIKNIKNSKYKLICLIMLDCGLRVTECVSLKLKNFDFKKRILTIESLKKRNTKKLRQIPISNRLYNCIADYLDLKKVNLEPNNFLFPSNNKNGYLCRKTVWKFLKNQGKKNGIINLHPHTLRHTFATHHLSAGTQLVEIKEMLGHSSFDTTLIYASIPTETLVQRVNQVTSKPKNVFQKLYTNWFPEKNRIINLNFSNEAFTIGRNQELSILNTNINKGINTIIIGPIGSGKSHLLESLETDKKIIRLDDTESMKKSLIQILLYLYKGDKTSILDLIWKGFSIEEIKKKVQRENVTQLCNTITAIVQKNEYVLIIDDITKIPPTAKKAIEKLKNTFIIITSAREIRANDTSFLWNFEQLKIENLNRNHALNLINQLITGIETENINVLREHIYNQTNGNPRAIVELVERYKKEPFLTEDIIRSIKHTGALPVFDMSYLIIIFLGAVSVLRYIARDVNQPSLRYIGAAALILLIISRPLFKNLKNKFI